MATFFSDFFGVDASVVEDYGAFDVSLINDLPLFIDPFLLFNSKQTQYKQLHDDIIRYLKFLRQKAAAGVIDDALLHQWYCFPEVRQNWLGFSESGNGGHGLGIKFARALHGSMSTVFADFGEEKITRGSHLEKVCLFKSGVGRDNISDFTTNLIKAFLYRFTEKFALTHLRDDQRAEVSIRNVTFNYATESWEAATFTLPWIQGDHVVLTPRDLLTRDENWINRAEMIRNFQKIPVAIPDGDLRALVASYFQKVLKQDEDKAPTQAQRDEAAAETIANFPELVDYYILQKENQGPQAKTVSAEKVRIAKLVFDSAIRNMQELLEHATFYNIGRSTYEECHARVAFLKDIIENKGGHRFFYSSKKELLIRHEKELQIMFRLVWFGTPSDVSSEVNDGRGPADFKVSRSASDKSIVEMKLAQNSKLKQNLAKQTEVYQAASDAKHAIKVVVFFSAAEMRRVKTILKELKLSESRDVVLIDARHDNKPTGSRAR